MTRRNFSSRYARQIKIETISLAAVVLALAGLSASATALGSQPQKETSNWMVASILNNLK